MLKLKPLIKPLTGVLTIGLPTLALAALSPSPAKAFTIITQPSSSYLSSTKLIDITGIPDFSSIDSISDGVQTVEFSSFVSKRQVPDSWLTWSSPPDSESSAPPVLYSNGLTSLSMALSIPSTIFGFELEPNPFASFNYTADFYSGSTLVGSISRTLIGAGGARLFAASDSPFTRVVVSGGADFGMAQFRYKEVPGPLPIFGVAAVFSYSRKLKKRIRASKILYSVN